MIAAADAFSDRNEDFLIVHMTVLPPIFREAARAGGGQHRLPEGFQDLGNFGKVFAAGIDVLQEFIDFSNDAVLLSERR
ncbi:MAG TPA: hypothetical protein VKV15_15875 [Bryobacteraceae bacterium]|nr:hypothetical protein [Bryobacteraceae bacterium]